MVAAGAGASLCLLGAGARASPIVPPDLTKCGLAVVNSPTGTPGAATSQVQCCLPLPTRAVQSFRFPPRGQPPRVQLRRPAHVVDPAYVAKYEEAYRRMRALPTSDPRSLRAQADIHCAFCNGAYDQLGSTNNKLQVHFSWLFLPWHRWFLYFHERILGSLIGDPHFSLVYWNWDNQTNVGANIMPTMFTKEGSPLYDAKRNPAHLPPTINTLNLASLTNNALSSTQVIQDNLNVMYQSMVTASTPDLFMGKKYSAGDPEPNIGGTLEMAPHTAIHAWVGDDRETYLEDMGNFYSAARDPIFFAHHSNVDRLWAIWNKLGGRRKDHTDPDFLDAQFVFYDENANMVKVNVKDALDLTKLGVVYQTSIADRLWLNFDPKPLSTTLADVAPLPEIGPASKNVEPTAIDKTLTCKAPRPSGIPSELLLNKGLNEDEVEEVLVLEGLQVPRNVVTHIVVFINLPDADENTPLSCAEYVGSFINIPHFVGEDMDMSMRTTNVRFGITDNLKKLGITDPSTLSVTIVAKMGRTTEVPITLQGISIEYE